MLLLRVITLTYNNLSNSSYGSYYFKKWNIINLEYVNIDYSMTTILTC